MPTFAVVWREPDGRAYSGRLEISDRQARLIGSDAEGARVHRAVWLDDVASIRTSRSQQERVNDQPVVVLERREAGPLRVAPLDGVGRVFELADLLAELAARIPTTDGRVAVVVPIRPRQRTRVQALVRRGPPFRPEDIAGLERHQVFVGSREVVFVFEGRDILEEIQRLLGQPRLWVALAAWRTLITGRPEIAEVEYTWTRTD